MSDYGYDSDGSFEISYLLVKEDIDYDVQISNTYQQKGYFGMNITFEVDMHDEKNNESGMHKFYLPKRPDPGSALARYLMALVGEERVKQSVSPKDLLGMTCQMRFVAKESAKTGKVSYIPAEVKSEYTDGEWVKLR